LRLHAQPKLLDTLRPRSRNPRLQVVAFKLTAGSAAEAAMAAVTSMLDRGAADLVVHNDVSRRGSGDDFPATIHQPGGLTAVDCPTRPVLAARLEQLLLSVPVNPQPESCHAPLS
jgi:hypothetical protein